MARVEIYTRPMCGFCSHAKTLLDRKGVAYAEYDIWAERGRKEEMLKRAAGRSTVPQIFINDEHVGGCDDIVALERAGKLDSKLGSAA